MPNSSTILESVAKVGLSHWEAAPFLKKVTDIAPNIIYIFNQLTQSNEYSNHSIGELLGYSTDDVLAMGDMLIPQLCHPDDLGGVIKHFENIQRISDGEVLQVEYRMRHRNGHWVWLLSYDTVFDRDGSGRVIRHIGAASDVTLQKLAEERAKTAALKEKTTNDELLAFSYSMSHDLKAPSNTIQLLLTEVLETHGAKMDPDAADLITLALKTSGNMSRLVDDVLNYTRVINQEISPSTLALGPLMEQAAADVSKRLGAKDAVIRINHMPEIIADRAQMVILFENLIENAILFQQPGSTPQIDINAEIFPNEGSAHLSVQDNGIGIPKKQQNQIFTIFKRLSSDPERAGAGLGLAICRRIAANHGSTITVVSEPGQGATFSIGLPIA